MKNNFDIIESTIKNNLDILQDTSTAFTTSLLVTAVFTFILYTLADYTKDAVDMSVLELIEQAGDTQLLSITLLHTWNKNLLEICMSDFTHTFNSVHYIIYHGAKQYLMLATFNQDLTFTYHAFACVDVTTTMEELAVIKTQFMNAIFTLFNTYPNLIDIQLIVCCNPIEAFSSIANPFNPLADYLATCTWSLLAFVYDENLNLHMYINSVYYNLHKLLEFRTYLVTQCELFAQEALSIPDEDFGTDTWPYLQATNQLIRYVENLYNIYGNIEPINNEFSNMVEDTDFN